MKRLWNFLVELADGLGRARQAGTYVRMGRPDLARKIMLKD